MTVSPNRPQDGDRPVFAASQAKTDDRLLSPALPPTLFALPNLNTPAETAPQEDAVKSGSSSVDTPQPGPVAAEEPATPADRSAFSAPASEQLSTSETVRDVPAGRGWMEKIGAHTLVLLMLVILVAAAWVTGTDEDNPPRTDSVVADLVEDDTNIDLDDIDVGFASAELPIPEHHSAAELDPPAAADVSVASNSQTDHSPAAFDNRSTIDASPASTRNYTEVSKAAIGEVPLTDEPALAIADGFLSPADSISEKVSTASTQTGPRLSKTPAWIDVSRYLPPAPKNKAPTADAESTVDAETKPNP